MQPGKCRCNRRHREKGAGWCAAWVGSCALVPASYHQANMSCCAVLCCAVLCCAGSWPTLGAGLAAPCPCLLTTPSTPSTAPCRVLFSAGGTTCSSMYFFCHTVLSDKARLPPDHAAVIPANLWLQPVDIPAVNRGHWRVEEEFVGAIRQEPAG